MFDNINFKRFDRSSSTKNYDYTNNNTDQGLQFDPKVITLDNPGFNMHVTVSNFMAESVMLAANTRSNPTRIHSLLRDNIRTRQDQQNFVIVKIHRSENVYAPATKTNRTKVYKTEIRIPGYMLNQGSVFIDELDCYITTESNLEATRELIANDLVPGDTKDQINIPSSMIEVDPVVTYNSYRSLVDFCIERQNKISIRVGVDLKHDVIPDYIKNFHIAILDHYFIPFAYHRLVFDPSLRPDEFVIENLHLSSHEVFRFSFTELAKIKSYYIDHDERETMMGKFYRMAIFADKQSYSDYLFERKTIERFDDETLFLAERSGDPRLKEEISKLQRNLATVTLSRDEAESDNKSLRTLNKRLASDLTARERTITQLRDRHEASLDADVVMKSMDNEAGKVRNDAEKIANDRVDQEMRASTMAMNHKATILKNIADIMKSGWGIVTGVVGGILAVIAIMKKYGVRVTMAT